MMPYDSASFAAGREAGTRVAACVARLAALELIEGARWWNHWRRRRMARTLVACAEELESAADEELESAADRDGPARAAALDEAGGDLPERDVLPQRRRARAGLRRVH